MTKFFEKYPITSLSLLVLVMLLVHLEIPNVTIMEARNFISAREMIQDNHWILTTMNGEARYQKPPLPTWLTAISALVFGVNSLFALRLPAALMVLFLGIFVYLLSIQLKLSKIHSFNNSLIAVTSFYVIGILNEAPWDIYAHGFMLAGIYYLFQFFQSSKQLWKNALLASIFVGFSILSKGPVSLFALFLPFIISYGIVYKFKNFKSKTFPFISFNVLFLIIGGWWFVYVRLADAEVFLKIATKEMGNWNSYNVRPFYYYWNFFIQSGIWTIPSFISLLYPYLKKQIQNQTAFKFTFWWTIIAVILLSLIPEKKPRYLMPVLIPLALNTGFYIQYLIKNFDKLKNKIETIPVYFNFVLIATIGFAFPFIIYFLLKNEIPDFLLSYILTSLSVVLISFYIIKNLLKRKIKNVFYLTILFIAAILIFGLPITTSINKNGTYNEIKTLHQIEKNNHIITYSIGEITPELLWNYKGKIKNIYKNNELKLPKENHFGLLLLNEDVPNITQILSKNYQLNLKEAFNLNKGSKNKERLIRQFYFVTKKHLLYEK
jgi:4-amino-4-deoxy-L-arabinose transferase-like glycosyltransferase